MKAELSSKLAQVIEQVPKGVRTSYDTESTPFSR